MFIPMSMTVGVLSSSSTGSIGSVANWFFSSSGTNTVYGITSNQSTCVIKRVRKGIIHTDDSGCLVKYKIT